MPWPVNNAKRKTRAGKGYEEVYAILCASSPFIIALVCIDGTVATMRIGANSERQRQWIELPSASPMQPAFFGAKSYDDIPYTGKNIPGLRIRGVECTSQVAHHCTSNPGVALRCSTASVVS